MKNLTRMAAALVSTLAAQLALAGPIDPDCTPAEKAKSKTNKANN
jgi:hypothetical protein